MARNGMSFLPRSTKMARQRRTCFGVRNVAGWAATKTATDVQQLTRGQWVARPESSKGLRNHPERRTPCDIAGAIQCRRGGVCMTTLLQKAFAAAGKLPEAEQDLLAARLLAEVAAEDDFDRTIARSSDKLVGLAREALAEHRSGQTEELDP